MLRNWMKFAFPRFYDVLDGAGGGAPVGDSSGAVTPPPAPSPSSAGGVGAAGTGQPGVTPGTTAPAPGFMHPEDRSRWIPPHRFNEVSSEAAQMRSALLNYQSRVRALMGVAEPEDPRDVELRESMKKKFPGLAKFIDNPDLVDRLEGGGHRQDDGFQTAYWARLGAETTHEALTAYATAAGVPLDKLGANASASMARHLHSYISADPSGQRTRAYEQRDPAFLKDFIADLTGFFVTPLRQATGVSNAQHAERARQLPSSRGAAGVPAGAGGAPAAAPKGKALHEAARQALLGMTNA